MGFKQAAYSHWENGRNKISPDARESLHSLGLNLNWLDTGTGNMLLQPDSKDPVEQAQTAFSQAISGEEAKIPDPVRASYRICTEASDWGRLDLEAQGRIISLLAKVLEIDPDEQDAKRKIEAIIQSFL